MKKNNQNSPNVVIVNYRSSLVLGGLAKKMISRLFFKIKPIFRFMKLFFHA